MLIIYTTIGIIIGALFAFGNYIFTDMFKCEPTMRTVLSKCGKDRRIARRFMRIYTIRQRRRKTYIALICIARGSLVGTIWPAAIGYWLWLYLDEAMIKQTKGIPYELN